MPGTEGREQDDRAQMPAATSGAQPLDRETMDWEALDRGEVVKFKDPQGQVQAATKLVTPEFYKQYMEGNERAGVLGVTPPEPTPEALDLIYQGVNQHWNALQEYDPQTVGRILRYPHLVMTDAELAAKMGNPFGPFDAGEYMSQALLGDANISDYETYDETWKETQRMRIFLERYSPNFAPKELDIMSTVFATLDAKSREHIASLAWAQARDMDLTKDDQRMEFLSWLYGQGQRESQATMARHFQFPLFKWIEAPQDFIEEFVKTRVTPYFAHPQGYLDPETNPNEWAMTGGLSLGEQLAIKLSINPDDTNFWWIAGVPDFAQEIGLDPLNLVAGLGAGSKLAASLPKVGKAAEMGRAALFLRSIVPGLGREIGAQTLPRGIMTRAYWSIFSKEVDELLETPKATAAIQRIFDTAQTSKWAGVVQKFPSLEKSGPTLGRYIEEATSPEDVKWILSNGFKGNFVSNGSDAYLLVERASRAADKAYTQASETLIDQGRLSYQGLMGEEDIEILNGLWDLTDEAVEPVARPRGGRLGTPQPKQADFTNAAGEIDWVAYRRNLAEWQEDQAAAMSKGEIPADESSEAGVAGRGVMGRNVEELDPEAVYFHATSHRSGIEEAGFRSRQELGAIDSDAHGVSLGGGAHSGISITTSEERANAIVGAYQEAARFVRGEISIDELVNKLGALSEDVAADFVSQAGRKMARLRNGVDNAGRKLTEKELDQLRLDLYSQYRMYLEDAGGDINPVILSRDTEAFRNLDPSELAVFRVKARPGTRAGFHPSEDEFRVGAGENLYVVDEMGREIGFRGRPGQALRIRQATLTGDGTARIAFRRGTKIGAVNQDSLQQIFRWAYAQGDKIAAKNAMTWLLGGTDGLTDEAMTLIEDFMRANGLDAIRREDGLALLRRDAVERVRGIMDDANAPPAWQSMSDLLAEKIDRNTRLASANRGDRSWFISDLPLKAVPDWKWWRHFASNNADGFWANFRRRAAAYTFGKVAPSKVNIGDGVQGATELRTILARIGVKRESIEYWYSEFLRAPFEERMAVVYDAVADAGRELDIAPLKFMLAQWANKNGVYSFGYDAAGNEIGIALSRSRPGEYSARPWLKTHYATHVDVPTEAILQTVKRWRQTQNKFEGLFTRGLLPSTRKAREGLAQRFGDVLKKRGQYLEGTFSDEDLIAMAYSVVGRDGGEGIGQLSRLTNSILVKPWNKIHQVFSVTQLAGRFLQWFERVVLGEEQVRGALTQLPSLYRNPFRWAVETWAAHVGRAQAVYAERNAEWVATQTSKLFDPLAEGGFDAVQADLTGKLPGFAPFLDNMKNKPTTLQALRSSLSRYLRENLALPSGRQELSRSGLRLSWALRQRARSVVKAETMRREIGLPVQDDWDDIVEEISHKGIWNIFTEEAASSVVPVTTTGKLTVREASVAGQSWGKLLHQVVHDPATSLGLRMLSDSILPPSGTARINYAGTVVRSSWWRQVRNGVKDILAERGLNVNGMGELELAQRYLDDIILPHVDNITAPLRQLDPADRARVLLELGRDKATHVEIKGYKYNLNLASSNVGSSVPTMRKMFMDLQPLGVEFPPKMASYFDPRFMSQDTGSVITAPMRKMSNWIIEHFGEKATQTMNRQPAWLATYKPWFKFYHEGLGIPKNIAYEMASAKATEKVNYVYYNLANSTPLLRKLGKVIPFFGAMWEVAQTWAWKIPTMEAGILGYPEMIRKVDRIYDVLVKLGILEFTASDEDEEGNKTVRLQVVATRDKDKLDAMTPGGAAISKMGFNLANSVPTLINHLSHLRNLSQEALETNTKDTYTWTVGNPFQPQSQGIMGVNQFYFSMNPAGSAATSLLLRALPGVTDSKVYGAKAGQNLDIIAGEAGVDVMDLVRTNSVALGDALGQETLFKLFTGATMTGDINLPSDLVLAVPGSSLMDTMLKDILFQFGEVESPAGVIREFVPQWAQYYLRGLGIWHGGEEGKFWRTNSDGEFELGGTFLQALSSPGMDTTSIGGQIATEIMNLEASEGLVTRWTQEVDKLNAMVDPESGASQEAYNSQKLLVEQLSAEITKRASDNAGSSMMVRGLLGFVSPATPRTLYKEQSDIALYWSAQEGARDHWENRGLKNWEGELPPGGVQGVEAFNGLLQRFLADPEGQDDARAFLRKTYPSLWAFAFGKSYWGPQGPPPEGQGFDKYLDEVESGQRKAYAPNIFLQRYARSAIAIDREIELLEKFGNDPSAAAVSILNSWREYQQIREEASVKMAALDYYDGFYDGHAYDNWRNRNQDDNGLLIEAQTQRMDEILEAGEMLEDLVPTIDMDPRDRQEFVAQIKNITGGVRDRINAWRDQTRDGDHASPREAILNWYFDSVMVPYYEGLNALYERVDAATDTEEQSRIYDEIRTYRNDTFTTRNFNPQTGDEFPNILDWAWNKKTDEERHDRLVRWANQPLEWLDLESVARLVAQEPVLSDYLPTRESDWQIYDETNSLRNALADMREAQPSLGGDSYLSQGQSNKVSTAIDERLQLTLAEQGRGGEITWRQMYPIERLELSNLLPQSLIPYSQQARYIRQLLEHAGPNNTQIGPKSAIGQRLFGYTYVQLLQEVATNPVLAADLRALGEVAFDESEWDSIFPKLMYGDQFGEE